MKMYKLDDIPKKTCFSRLTMNGAYYEDTEEGEKRSWQKYNMDGEVQLSSVTPDTTAMYYLSDRYGKPLTDKLDIKVDMLLECNQYGRMWKVVEVLYDGFRIECIEASAVVGATITCFNEDIKYFTIITPEEDNMKKENAIEMSKLLKFWGNGGTIWGFSSNDSWFKVKDYMDISLSKYVYVIEDKHFEARKAFAEGKRLQYRNSITGTWIILDKPTWTQKYYREKPTEWYEHTKNKGIPIMVRNNTLDVWKARTFFEYKRFRENKYQDDSGIHWHYARLMTREDVPYVLRSKHEDS